MAPADGSGAPRGAELDAIDWRRVYSGLRM